MALRVIVDGDSNKVYRKGDRVTGRVILVVEETQHIESLKVVFAGNCITKTSRPFHVNGCENSPSMREYEEKIRLFNQEQQLFPQTTLTPKKYTWTFEFTFPTLTEPRYKRLAHGATYPKDPHALPPTFQLKTNVPGGAAQICYFIQARLTRSTSADVKRCRVVLPYHPTPHVQYSREAKCTSAVLYGQTWKPSRTAKGEKAVSKVYNKVARPSSNTPRIVPSILYPESIAPGQNIPLSLSLRNTRDALNEAQAECTVNSLSVTISTYSTSMCGHTLNQPEDVVSKHVTCIARSNMNKPLRIGDTISLTSNFRLVNDVECIPTFKTYTITRKYVLSISIGINFGVEQFTIRSSTPLEILPRVPRTSVLPPVHEDEDVEPLPRYEPREPSKEFAPDYEEIFALSRMESASSEGSNRLTPTYSRSSSFMSNVSGASESSAGASTPASEIEEPSYGQTAAVGT
ncbi:hypothetical protein EK21DRAFT_97153 [Setomelanomma holmii]|uniref:Arrestin-like N-terminal domain-containing protein n=1 Tax=Setomelanomma holmii TaxID=210430 RepID=A0A9P4LS06_9PLEO|nr:hypothetical protein EK21DRAFT_97153 [Setomelanomma holmii]